MTTQEKLLELSRQGVEYTRTRPFTSLDGKEPRYSIEVKYKDKYHCADLFTSVEEADLEAIEVATYWINETN